MLKSISQMPVVLVPLHFDRDPVDRKPSAQRSIVLRPFMTSDFMTGMPVIPGSEKLPMNVSSYLHHSTDRHSLPNLFLGNRANGNRHPPQRARHFSCPLRSHKQASRDNRVGVKSVADRVTRELNNRCIIMKNIF